MYEVEKGMGDSETGVKNACPLLVGLAVLGVTVNDVYDIL